MREGEREGGGLPTTTAAACKTKRGLFFFELHSS